MVMNSTSERAPLLVFNIDVCVAGDSTMVEQGRHIHWSRVDKGTVGSRTSSRGCCIVKRDFSRGAVGREAGRPRRRVTRGCSKRTQRRGHELRRVAYFDGQYWKRHR